MVFGICYVIDVGIVCISCYSVYFKVQWLLVELIVCVSVDQCVGCSGCIMFGVVYWFYDEDDFNNWLVFIDLEIQCINLGVVILCMVDLKLGVVEDFFFIELLDGCLIWDGYCFLEEFGVFDK